MDIYKVVIAGGFDRYYIGMPDILSSGALACGDAQVPMARGIVFSPSYWQSFEEADEGEVVQLVADHIVSTSRAQHGWDSKTLIVSEDTYPLFPGRIIDLALEMAKEILVIEDEASE